MTTIYVVVAGNYSDYHIVAAFSSQELADLCVKEVETGKGYSDNDPRVVDFELDEYSSELRAGLVTYYVSMARDGTTRRIKRDSGGGYSPQLENDLLCGYVWATDELHAVKIVNEKRIMLIANDEWKDSQS